MGSIMLSLLPKIYAITLPGLRICESMRSEPGSDGAKEVIFFWPHGTLVQMSAEGSGPGSPTSDPAKPCGLRGGRTAREATELRRFFSASSGWGHRLWASGGHQTSIPPKPPAGSRMESKVFGWQTCFVFLAGFERSHICRRREGRRNIRGELKLGR